MDDQIWPRQTKKIKQQQTKPKINEIETTL